MKTIIVDATLLTRPIA